MIPSNSVQLVFVGGCFRMFVVAVVGTYLVDLGYSNEALPVLLEISSTNYVSFKSFNVLLLLHISPPSATDRHLYPEPCESILPTNHFARIMEVLGGWAQVRVGFIRASAGAQDSYSMFTRDPTSANGCFRSDAAARASEHWIARSVGVL